MTKVSLIASSGIETVITQATPLKIMKLMSKYSDKVFFLPQNHRQA